MGSEQSTNKMRKNQNMGGTLKEVTNNDKIANFSGHASASEMKSRMNSKIVESSSDRELRKWEEERKRLLRNCIFIDF